MVIIRVQSMCEEIIANRAQSVKNGGNILPVGQDIMFVFI